MEDNICLKTYHLLAEDYDLPPVEIHLHKNIPIGAGLGGGSSDAAFMIKALNDKFELKLSIEKMENYAKKLGADCAFFIQNKPLFAEGIGTDFSEIDINLSNYHFVVVKPQRHISTSEAYQSIIPDPKGKGLRKAIQMPIENWKNSVINDFEAAIFKNYPEVEEIKQQLYNLGAVYASMSGSGSALFGIFKEKPYFPENKNKYTVFYCEGAEEINE
jgi:4-diphosphocytidyl-2-C-methyl-D-erythritol kinase